jgi:hypothetical protein
MGSFSKQLNGYGFTKIKLGVNQYTYYHPFFLRGLPHLVKNIKRNVSVASPAKGGRQMTEADLERISAEAPLPDRVGATCGANAAIQKINNQYNINQLQEEEPFEPLDRAQALAASCPYPPDITSSNIHASQLGGHALPPPVNYQPMLPLSAMSQFQNIAPSVNSPFLLGGYNLPPLGRGVPAPEVPAPAGWDGVTNALLQAFQTAQVQRQLQEQAHQAQLTLLANALAADLQNTQSHLPYPPLTPSQIGILSSAMATLNSARNIPSTIYTPRWLSLLQQPQLFQQPQQQQQRNSNLNDGSNFFPNNTEQTDENENEQNNM